MKNINFNHIALGALIGLFVLSLMSSSYAPVTPSYYAFSSGAIANSENDTLKLPTKFAGQGTLMVTLRRTNVSGTTNIGCILQATDQSTSTPAYWITQPDSAATTTATNVQIKIPITYGYQYRAILDGRGTQSSTYILSYLFKPTP